MSGVITDKQLAISSLLQIDPLKIVYVDLDLLKSDTDVQAAALVRLLITDGLHWSHVCLDQLNNTDATLYIDWFPQNNKWYTSWCFDDDEIEDNGTQINSSYMVWDTEDTGVPPFELEHFTAQDLYRIATAEDVAQAFDDMFKISRP